MVAPANVATARMAPNTSSATSKRRPDVRFVPAMLCPATSTVATGLHACRTGRARFRRLSVTGAVPQCRTGRAGADGVSAVATPAGRHRPDEEWRVIDVLMLALRGRSWGG